MPIYWNKHIGYAYGGRLNYHKRVTGGNIAFFGFLLAIYKFLALIVLGVYTILKYLGLLVLFLCTKIKDGFMAIIYMLS